MNGAEQNIQLVQAGFCEGPQDNWRFAWYR